jgi:arylsulfatase A-like enzyme
LAALGKTGLDRNTIIIFLSDNGLTLGDHGFGATKNCPYEACVKVPFIVYAPGYFSARREAALVANIDILPTLVELAQAAPADQVDGLSLVPLLKDASAAWRSSILLEHWPTEEGVGSTIPEFYSVRTAQWKYTEYVTGEAELYDLALDPFELENVVDTPDLESVRLDLAAQLHELKAR